ncbi:MAG: hypothetical protein QOE19_3870 [Actinomycetota bacterium]|jgi:uncharacterized membrane protein YeaQ/YmgE (transglycosylase-associated protein family)|nr:hypothetical protein [Actinomycetota bacterium]MDQ1664853.1 hypothetical protein [Actinomycetota bacterium]
MTSSGFFSAILVGLVIGALGRLVVPGRQAIGCLFTLLLGIVGAIAGAAIAEAAGVRAWPLVLACQVAVAAVGVVIVAGAMRGPRFRRRPPQKF